MAVSTPSYWIWHDILSHLRVFPIIFPTAQINKLYFARRTENNSSHKVGQMKKIKDKWVILIFFYRVNIHVFEKSHQA